MVFHKRDTNVIEIQQTDNYAENPDDACLEFDPNTTPHTTLISKYRTLIHLSRFVVVLDD